MFSQVDQRRQQQEAGAVTATPPRSVHEPAASAAVWAGEAAEGAERIEEYLDQVCGRLLSLSYRERRQIRVELRQHIEASADAHQELGAADEEAAVSEALRRFGEPERVARSFRAAYHATGRRRYGGAFRDEVRRAARVFGVTGLLTFASGEAIGALHSAGIPNLGWLSCWNAAHVLLTVVILPALLGGVMGARAGSHRPVFSTFCALSVLCGLTIPLNLLLIAALPLQQNQHPHYVQHSMSLTFFVWMPVAVTAAAMAHGLRRLVLRRRPGRVPA